MFSFGSPFKIRESSLIATKNYSTSFITIKISKIRSLPSNNFATSVKIYPFPPFISVTVTSPVVVRSPLDAFPPEHHFSFSIARPWPRSSSLVCLPSRTPSRPVPPSRSPCLAAPSPASPSCHLAVSPPTGRAPCLHTLRPALWRSRPMPGCAIAGPTVVAPSPSCEPTGRASPRLAAPHACGRSGRPCGGHVRSGPVPRVLAAPGCAIVGPAAAHPPLVASPPAGPRLAWPRALRSGAPMPACASTGLAAAVPRSRPVAVAPSPGRALRL
jgi:hypothetical protein